MLFMRCIIVLGLMGVLLSHPGISPKTIRQTEMIDHLSHRRQ